MPQATNQASPRQRTIRQTSESPAHTSDSPANEDAKQAHRGWEMSAYDALRVDYVDHEVETRLKR